MRDSTPIEIMRRGSTTFFNSSMFFPKNVRTDVVTLYAFVRTADDYVDRVPPDRDGFMEFLDSYKRAQQGQATNNSVVTNFVALSNRRRFEPEWTQDFLNTMEQDLWKTRYETLEETDKYMHGSAEVVGFMMARIMNLPDESLPYAGLLGKAFQYLNFIRDIKEDLEMGRVYIPIEEITRFGLPELSLNAANEFPDRFTKLIRAQLNRYREWRLEAAKGYRFIPRRYLIAIKTAADVFDLTAAEIDANPLVVFERKVKPSRRKVLAIGLRNLITARASTWKASGDSPTASSKTTT